MKTLSLKVDKQPKDRLIIFLAMALLLGGCLFTFPSFYLMNTNVLVGFCLLPFAVFFTGTTRNNWFYLIAGISLLVLSAVYGVRLFYFFAAGFCVLWFVELSFGRTNILIVFLLGFMSPAFSQVVSILGFPLRLLLSEYAGLILQSANFNVQVEGNVMLLNGNTFSVDDACMGLNMLAFSFLMGVFLLSHRYRIEKKCIGLFPTISFFICVFVLNVLANLFRIMALVIFNVQPEHFLHEAVGILSLLVYTVLPIYLISRWFVLAFGHSIALVTQRPPIQSGLRWVVCTLSIILFAVGVHIKSKRSLAPVNATSVSYNNSETELLGEGIHKVQADDRLIYFKPIQEFFTGEHSPLLCWKGSGYKFTSIKEVKLQGTTVYFAKLTKGQDELQTAWWFTNGHVNTISQLEWRKRMFVGEDNFWLVNVTTKDIAALTKAVKELVGSKDLVFKGN